MSKVALLLLLTVSCSSGSAVGYSASADASDDPPERSESKGARGADRPCPSLPQRTSASFLFKPGLAGPAVFELEVSVDGQQESCTITLGKPNPAVEGGGVVMMGQQQQATTCKLVMLGGTFSDGSLSSIEREGESKQLRVTISEKGKRVAEGTFTPDFTPDECGQRTRYQELVISR
jgi:hypothetical protein